MSSTILDPNGYLFRDTLWGQGAILDFPTDLTQTECDDISAAVDNGHISRPIDGNGQPVPKTQWMK